MSANAVWTANTDNIWLVVLKTASRALGRSGVGTAPATKPRAANEPLPIKAIRRTLEPLTGPAGLSRGAADCRFGARISVDKGARPARRTERIGRRTVARIESDVRCGGIRRVEDRSVVDMATAPRCRPTATQARQKNRERDGLETMTRRGLAPFAVYDASDVP